MPRVSGAGASPAPSSSSSAAATVRPRGVVRRRRKAAAAAAKRKAGGAAASVPAAATSTGEEGGASSSSSSRNNSSSSAAVGEDGRGGADERARGRGVDADDDDLRFDDVDDSSSSSSSSSDDLSAILTEGAKTHGILRGGGSSGETPSSNSAGTTRAAIDTIDDPPSDLDDEDDSDDEEEARFEELRRRRREAAMAAKRKGTALLDSSSSGSSGSDDDGDDAVVVVTANDGSSNGGTGRNGEERGGGADARGSIPTSSTQRPKRRGESKLGSASKSPNPGSKEDTHHGSEDGPTVGGAVMRAVCTGGARKKRVSFHKDVKKASPKGGRAKPVAKSAGRRNVQSQSKSKTTPGERRRGAGNAPGDGGGRVGATAGNHQQPKKKVVRRSVVTPTPTKAARKPPRQPTASSSSSSSSTSARTRQGGHQDGTTTPHPPASRVAERGRIPDDNISNPRGEVRVGPDASTSPSPQHPTLPNNRALAVDTRVLRRYPHESAGRVFLDQTLRFLRSAARRGALPRILATPVASLGAAAGTGEGDPSPQSGRNGGGGGKNGGSDRRRQQQRQQKQQPPQRKRVTIEARAATLPTDILTGWGHSGATEQGGGGDNGQGVTPEDVGEEMAWKGLLVPVHVRMLGEATGFPRGDGNDGRRVPKSLLAHDSWRLFADLVDVMTEEASKSRGNVAASNETVDRTGSQVTLNQHKCPLDVTILTNDVGLFTDTNADSHRRALGRFWERVRVAFDSGKVRSLSIVVVETGVMHIIDPIVGGGAPAPSITLHGIDGDGTSPPMAVDPSVVGGADENDIRQSNIEASRATGDKQDPKLSTSSSSDEIVDGVSTPSTTRRGGEAPQIRVAKSLRALRAQLSSLQELDYVRNTGTGNGTSCSCPITVDLDVMECNTIAFGRMLRGWLRRMVGAASRISFQLPETMDGTVCSIDLDLEYTLLPYPASSAAATKLVQDARSLSGATFEVVQVVPNAKVDASLIYGIAMSAKAGLESDLFRHQEMKSLVRQLWKWLARNDSSLILRASSTYDEGYIGHHEYFLLMSEEVVDEPPSSSTQEPESDRRGCAPCNGTLLRYAAEEQILKDGVEDDSCEMAASVYETESDHQYYEYIERSLEYLDREFVNPILLGCTSGSSLDGHESARGDEDSTANQTGNSDSNAGNSTSDFDRWKEESGVGATMGSPVCGEHVDCGDEEEADGSFLYS